VTYYNIKNIERFTSAVTPPTGKLLYFSPSSTCSLWGECKICSLLAKEFMPHKRNSCIPAGGIQLLEWEQLQSEFQGGSRATLAVEEQKMASFNNILMMAITRTII
jgi:hypothetical protein